MNVIEAKVNIEPSVDIIFDINSFLESATSYKARDEKYKEIISFLIQELKRIAEYNNNRDISKYTNSIKYYILEDMGLHEDAMALKTKFYLSGNRFPFLPMVNLFSFYY